MDWVEAAAELKFDKGISWTQLPEELERTTGERHKPEKIRAALRRHPKYKKDIVFEDRKTYDESDVDTYIEKMKELQAAQEKLNTKQVKATFAFPGNKPVGVAWWGDWHIGAVGTDYEQFEKDLEAIISTDGLYWIGAGDYKDNYITGTHPGGSFEQIIRPGMQDLVVQRYMERASDKCIALVRGCHDDWDKKQGDKDFISAMAETADAVNLWHGGEITLKVGGEPYIWRVRHKYPYESSLNLENSMRRINEIQGPCDVAAVAHLHNVYVMARHLMGQMRYMARTGSYKIWDEYGQKLAGYKAKMGVPVFIMYPNEHRLKACWNLRDGIEALNEARK